MMAAMSGANATSLVIGVLFGLGLLIIAGWLLIGAVSLTARTLRRWSQQAEGIPAEPAQAYGFPVVTEPSLTPVAMEAGGLGPVPVQEIGRGPGRYRIVGVVAVTGTDIRMYVNAETPANAKVKAELKGVIVTEVEKQ